MIDDHHEPALIVPYTLAFGHKPVLFPRDAAVVHIGQTGNLDDLIDVVKDVENRVIARDILDFSSRQDLP